MFVHFTNSEDAKKIQETGKLKGCSYIVSSVFAVSLEGGEFFPNVQLSPLGEGGKRDVAVIFDAYRDPDFKHPEEVVWKEDYIELKDIMIVPSDEAIELLHERTD